MFDLLVCQQLMADSDQITLRVGAVPPNSRSDIGDGIARIDATSMETLGVEKNDPIWIRGEQQTPARVKESFPADKGLGIIRIDSITRKNAGIDLGQEVDIQPAESHRAETVIFEIEPIISESSMLEEQVDILNDIYDEHIVDIQLSKNRNVEEIKEEHKNTLVKCIHNNLTNQYLSKNNRMIVDPEKEKQVTENELESWAIRLELVEIISHSKSKTDCTSGYYITEQTEIQLQNKNETPMRKRNSAADELRRSAVEPIVDPAVTTVASRVEALDLIEYDGLSTLIEGSLLPASLECESVVVVGLYEGDEGEGWRLASAIPLPSNHNKKVGSSEPANDDTEKLAKNDTEHRASSKKVDPPDTIPAPPTIDIEYESLIEKAVIEQGQNAKIVRAVDPDSGTSVAVKTPSFSRTFTETETFLGEAERWNVVDEHDHVVTVFDWGVHDGVPWIAIEYMDGGQLREYAGQCSIQQALWTAVKISDAVYHAHRQGVVHLDLKPENILFRSVDDAWNVPKVADWGLSKPLIEDANSVDGVSLPYAAPETLPSSDGCIDIVTDVYQLGAVFYELVTGRPPFDKSSLDITDQIKNDTPTPPSNYTQVPDSVDEIILTALEKEREKRYEDVLFLREELLETFEQF